MRILDGTVVLSPTDLTGYLACEHLTELERDAAEQGTERPARHDPELELLRARGDAHEQAYLERLEAQGRSVAVIEREGPGLSGLLDFEARTLAAMRAGFDYICQGGFFDGRWYGRADFLRRVEPPSRLGDWSYEVEDTKLARRLKVAALIQTADYSRHVARLQGRVPRSVHIVLGDNTVESRPLADISSYYEAARSRFERALADRERSTYPDPVDHCRVCRWADVCEAKRRNDDHLSLVAGAHRRQTAKLQAAGVSTASQLAARADPVPHLSDASLLHLRSQATLQLAARRDGVMRYELLRQEAPAQGLSLLPEPCPGDLFFDMEGDGLVGKHGLEYLFGVLEVVDGAERYTPFWGHDSQGERLAFEAFMDFVSERLRRHPGLHIYHYAPYEPSALKRLAGRYGTREDELDRLLRGKVLIDLYAAVRKALQASTESYSLKALEPLYMASRTDRIRDAGSSVVAYERWLESGDAAALQDIAEYNETDCRSTLLMRNWLESMRTEYEARFGEHVLRPELVASEPSEDNAAITAETEDLVHRLTLGMPERPDLRSAEQQARTLLAGMLDWHRREARPQWWEYFARLEMDPEQLFEDAYAVAGLEAVGPPATHKRSVLQRYAFDPAQETRIDVGSKWVDPETRVVAGEVVEIDRSAGVIQLRRGPANQERGHPRALVPDGPVKDTEMRKAMRRVGEWVASHELAAPGPYRAARDLLLRHRPRVNGHADGTPLRKPGETAVEAACRIALALDSSCLPVQGPPGTGKTYTAAHIALALSAQNPRRRVGITALSHRAISHLVSEICTEAERAGRTLRVIQKAEEGQACDSPFVRSVANPRDVEEALSAEHVDIVAGTAWLFSREQMEGTLDTLIVDEASQMSLANVVAMSGSARNVILCGDPQQLNQPTRGTHPPGAERSALEHVLDGAHTVATDAGLFLDVTRRMHPALCEVISDVFYDGLLTAEASCGLQEVRTALPALSGAGLRYLPVNHAGNSVRSDEEARAVAALVTLALSGSWTDAHGELKALTESDVVVLAPYNAQVSTVLRHVPATVRVGTVDKFQGQQAAFTVYSMATSSAGDQRRGMDFLYSLNRLDVALSRAKAIAVLVCSPELTLVNCRTVRQLLLANALCRLIDRATPLDAPDGQLEISFRRAPSAPPAPSPGPRAPEPQALPAVPRGR